MLALGTVPGVADAQVGSGPAPSNLGFRFCYKRVGTRDVFFGMINTERA